VLFNLCVMNPRLLLTAEEPRRSLFARVVLFLLVGEGKGHVEKQPLSHARDIRNGKRASA